MNHILLLGGAMVAGALLAWLALFISGMKTLPKYQWVYVWVMKPHHIWLFWTCDHSRSTVVYLGDAMFDFCRRCRLTLETSEDEVRP